MQNKTALIVDDSRTAAQMLRLMLEREAFQVDVLGSAEDAIGYLRDHRPGIIFMDHLMPGMDGFQAVKEIKGSSMTASIPIVMYTSNSGDVYVGQAQALGAADILWKPPTRESLRAVFRRIDKQPEAVNEPVIEPAVADEESPDIRVLTPAPALEDTDAGETAENIAVRAAERSVPRSDSRRSAIVADATGAFPAKGTVSWWWVLIVAWVAFIGGTHFPGQGARQQPWLDALSWAVEQGTHFSYGEVPFSGRRVDNVRGLIARLAAAGFKGSVHLQGSVGTFCLVADVNGWKMPDPEMPIMSCDTIGPSGQESLRLSSMQSPEFREFLRSPEANRDIRIVVEGLGDTKPRQQYPEINQVRTAGDWNRIAELNNRILVTLVTAP